jgi:two-component system nitrate/nitrite response regulator NarL
VATPVEGRDVAQEEVVDVHGKVIAIEEARPREGDPVTLTAAVLASNELVRRGIAGLLRVIPEIGPVREIAGRSGVPLLGAAADLDLIIVTCSDVDCLPDVDAERAAQVLVVIDPATVEEVTSQVSQLADGFLWQPTLSAERLWHAIRRVRGGEAPVPPELTQNLLSRMDADDVRRSRPGSINLTGREREALALLVKGLSNKQIAKRLAISSHGAKRLVTSIMLKLDAPNRTLAAVTAVRAGLVDDARGADDAGP